MILKHLTNQNHPGLEKKNAFLLPPNSSSKIPGLKEEGSLGFVFKIFCGDPRRLDSDHF